MLSIKDQRELDNYDEVALYDNHGFLVGFIDNMLTLADVRVQIKNLGLEGYYMLYKNETILIDSDGRMEFKDKMPFEAFSNLLIELL